VKNTYDRSGRSPTKERKEESHDTMYSRGTQQEEHRSAGEFESGGVDTTGVDFLNRGRAQECESRDKQTTNKRRI
jgi:hypothetical protein